MRVIGYARVSTEEQAKSGLGLEAQLRKIKAYCDLYDLDLIDIVIDDGVSGKTLNREGLNKVLNMLENNEADGVVIAKLDRLTRSVADMGYLLNKVFQRRELFSVSENVDTRTASGRLVLNVLISVAQWERETIVERTKDALQAKKARGEKTGGDVPFGYEVTPEGKLIENPKEQEIIRLIISLRNKGYGYKKIAKALNEKGYKTKHGKAFSHMQVKRILERVVA
ncbi:MAG: recombinase family protein [Candidatus Hodarchaeales archaeon]